MRDARVDEVEHVSDSDSEEREDQAQSQARLTVAIYPQHQGVVSCWSFENQESVVSGLMLSGSDVSNPAGQAGTGQLVVPSDGRIRWRSQRWNAVRAAHPEADGNRRRSE